MCSAWACDLRDWVSGLGIGDVQVGSYQVSTLTRDLHNASIRGEKMQVHTGDATTVKNS